MRFLLFSDLHLDTQFCWASPRLAQKRRQAIRDTLVRIVDLAIDTRVDAVLCGGDLYEHERFTPDTRLFLRSIFGKLHPVPIYIAPGNHDWYGPLSLYHQVEWTDNVYIFKNNWLEPVEIEDGLTLWGAGHCAPAGTKGFLENFSCNRRGINFALFHGSEMGWLDQQGSDKAPHAPFRSDEILMAGLNHAFLGHYHLPKDTEYFTYPGNPEPLSFAEDGTRGPVLIDVGQDGSVERERRIVASTQYIDEVIDISECGSFQDVRNLVALKLRGHHGIARITLHGEMDSQMDLHPNLLTDATPWMEDVVVRMGDIRSSYDFETLAKEQTVRGEFVRAVNGANLSEETRRRVLITGLRALEGRDDLEAPYAN